MIKFTVHPGFLPSVDGSPPVFFSYERLMSLYNVDPLLCVDARDFTWVRKDGRWVGGPAYARRLRPRKDGDYSLDRPKRSKIDS